MTCVWLRTPWHERTTAESTKSSTSAPSMKPPHTLIWLAIVLVVAWVVLRIALAVTSVALHLLWIVALVCAAFWLYRQFTGAKSSE